MLPLNHEIRKIMQLYAAILCNLPFSAYGGQDIQLISNEAVQTE
jgi:hypothetical protein